jgi:hypothetical protein
MQTQQEKNASVYRVIDILTSANPIGTQKVLQDNGFEFKYGQNALLADKYLLKLYSNSPDEFFSIVKQIPIEKSKVNPPDRDFIDKLISESPIALNEKSGWFQSALGLLEGTTTTTYQGTPQKTETSPTAYAVYIVIGIMIIGIVVYMFKTIK